MVKKQKIYRDVMSSFAMRGNVHLYIKFENGVCGLIKDIVNVEVWESINAVTFVTENGSKISYPTDVLSEYCILGE